MIKTVCTCDICGKETSLNSGYKGPTLDISYLNFISNAGCADNSLFNEKSLLDKAVHMDICSSCADDIRTYIFNMKIANEF